MPLHRIGTVRGQQGVSLRSAARQLGTNTTEVRRQEQEDTDLRLSELYAWQGVLEVPLDDLLVEPEGPLSKPVEDRARFVRLMKTAKALLEAAETDGERRLAQTLIDQLIEEPEKK